MLFHASFINVGHADPNTVPPLQDDIIYGQPLWKYMRGRYVPGGDPQSLTFLGDKRRVVVISIGRVFGNGH